MSRAQENSYRTHTNHELNAYRDRLDAKLEKLIDKKEKWFHIGACWIQTEQSNIIKNPNGSWKWNGWEVVGVEYAVRVFSEADVTVEGSKTNVHGLALATQIFENDRDKANEYFKWVRRELA